MGSVLSFLIIINSVLAQEQEKSAIAEHSSEHHGIAKNKRAPNFESKTLDGEKIKLSDYRGQYVLIDFWGT